MKTQINYLKLRKSSENVQKSQKNYQKWPANVALSVRRKSLNNFCLFIYVNLCLHCLVSNSLSWKIPAIYCCCFFLYFHLIYLFYTFGHFRFWYTICTKTIATKDYTDHGFFNFKEALFIYLQKLHGKFFYMVIYLIEIAIFHKPQIKNYVCNNGYNVRTCVIYASILLDGYICYKCFQTLYVDTFIY